MYENFTFPSIHEGPLILVNPTYPLKQTTHIHLSTITTHLGLYQVASDAARHLQHVLDALATDEISIVDAYRTHAFQENLYRETEKEFGMTYTQNFVALPGCSEHQTGLAIDMALLTKDIDPICPEFPRFGIAERFRTLALEHGFVERYLEHKKELTTIAAEAWHFRYLGYPHSKIIASQDFCLEEYHDFLKDYRYGDRHFFYHDKKHAPIQIAYLAEKDSHYLEKLHPDYHYQISGNNIDGFIITIWEEPPYEK